MSTPEQRAELRRLAEEATPGPWEYALTHADGAEYSYVRSVEDKTDTIGTGMGRRDAQYIAKANPATILSLLDELKAAEEERDRWKEISDLHLAQKDALNKDKEIFKSRALKAEKKVRSRFWEGDITYRADGNATGLCDCGCGTAVRNGWRYKKGHDPLSIALARIAELESRKPEQGRETVPREIAHALWCEGARLRVNLKASVTMSPENWHVEGVEQRLAAWDKAAERYFDFSQGHQPPAVSEAKEGSHDGDSGASRTSGGQHG